MLIKVSRASTFTFEPPVRSLIQVLRLTPRNFEGQHVMGWRIDVDTDCQLSTTEDAFGNITHALYIDGAIQRLRLTVVGEVETSDTGGVLRGGLERLPVQVFLRETPLTLAGVDLRSYATDVTGGRDDRLDRLHDLLAAIHTDIAVSEEPAGQDTNAAKAFSQGQGCVQDLAHIFISAARHIGAPARFVSGHLFRHDEEVAHNAAHAWAEAHVEGLGWVGFDPVTGACPTDAYVRVASALDYLGAAPVRGARFGGGKEHLDVSLSVAAEPGWRGQ